MTGYINEAGQSKLNPKEFQEGLKLRGLENQFNRKEKLKDLLFISCENLIKYSPIIIIIAFLLTLSAYGLKQTLVYSAQVISYLLSTAIGYILGKFLEK